MTEVKAIETAYKGHRFRSRLEARWAVFFDALGLAWNYEPEGYEKDGERYLPDFRLTLGDEVWWAEIKGDAAWLNDNRDQLSRWFGGEPIVPGGRLLVLGELPEPQHGALIVKTILCCDGRASEGWAALEAWRGKGRVIGWPSSALSYFQDRTALAGFQPFFVRAPLSLKGVKEAVTSARSARFEHGESGAR